MSRFEDPDLVYRQLRRMNPASTCITPAWASTIARRCPACHRRGALTRRQDRWSCRWCDFTHERTTGQ